MKLYLADLLSCFICILILYFYISGLFLSLSQVHLEPNYFLYTGDDVNEKLFFRMIPAVTCLLNCMKPFLI